MLAVNFYVKDVAPHFVGFFWVGSSAKHQQHRFIGWYMHFRQCASWSSRWSILCGISVLAKPPNVSSPWLPVNLFPGGFWRKEGPGSDLPINLYRFVRVMKKSAPAQNALLPCGGFVLSKSCLCVVAGGGGGVFLFNWDDIGDIYRYSHPWSFLKFQILPISWDKHTHTFLDHIWVVL